MSTSAFTATYVGEVKTDAKVVIGIDFGTSYSGISFVYQNLPLEVNIGAPSAKRKKDAVKVPTVLFKSPNGWAFGDEAAQKYVDKLDDYYSDETGGLSSALAADRDGYYLFRGFKMVLKDKSAGFDSLRAKSTTGHSHSLMDLIKRCLEYLSVFALNEVKCGFGRALGITEKDILWVLTVPAIWNDFGKSFMRKAAHKAGIIKEEASDKLILALEPESASIAVHGEGFKHGLFKKGTSFMVLDCGGGTVDITTHQVSEDKPLVLDEITRPTGGPWGGEYVDAEFRSFLRILFGGDTFRKLEEGWPAEVAEVVERFRDLKEEFDPDSDGDTNRISLASLFHEEIAKELNLPDLLSLVESLNKTDTWPKFDLSVKQIYKRITRDSTLIFTNEQMLRFFEPTLKNTCAAVRGILSSHSEVGIVVVVGGYGSSKALGARIRKEFEGGKRTVVIPDYASLRPQAAVVHGASYFGLYTVIGSRIAKFTYGVGATRRWERNGKYPESAAEYDSRLKEKRVRNVFSTIVEKGTSIPPTEKFKREDYQPLYDDQDTVSFPIFKSEHDSPCLTTDSGCAYLGKISVPCRSTKDQFAIEFSFSTELQVKIVRHDDDTHRTTVRMD